QVLRLRPELTGRTGVSGCVGIPVGTSLGNRRPFGRLRRDVDARAMGIAAGLTLLSAGDHTAGRPAAIRPAVVRPTTVRPTTIRPAAPGLLSPATAPSDAVSGAPARLLPAAARAEDQLVGGRLADHRRNRDGSAQRHLRHRRTEPS